MKERLEVSGTVSIIVYDQYGKIKDSRNIRNLIVENGRKFIASRMVSGTAMGVMSHMAVGTGSTTPLSGQTGLDTEISSFGRVALTSSTLIGTPPVTIQYSATFPSGTAGTVLSNSSITEAGIFNTANPTALDAIMLCRTTFTAVNKAAGDTLAITWNVTINAS